MAVDWIDHVSGRYVKQINRAVRGLPCGLPFPKAVGICDDEVVHLLREMKPNTATLTMSCREEGTRALRRTSDLAEGSWQDQPYSESTFQQLVRRRGKAS